MKDESEEPPPDSSDLEGWRKAVASGRLAQFPPEAMVAALQDLGPDLDAAIRDPIADRLNRMLMSWLRQYIGFNHPAGGEDIIVATHFMIFEALLDKTCADGKALRVAFWARVSFRAKDAIATEYHDSRIPLTHEPKKDVANDDVPLDKDKETAVRHLVQPSEAEDETEDASGFVGDDAVYGTDRPSAELVEELKHLEESMDVERVLAQIKDLDWRKRLAFRLHMEKVPAGSKKGFSIAKAVGRSSKTVEKWIKKIQNILKETKEVRELTSKKAGERS